MDTITRILTGNVYAVVAADLFFSPLTWLALWGMWNAIKWALTGREVDVYPAEEFSQLPPGSFTEGGSTATSKTEQEIREWLSEASGLSLQRPSLKVVSPFAKASGGYRHLTPDIVIKAGNKICVVEVDPLYTHGKTMTQLYDDMERNKAYAILGFHVVRIRMGWPNDNSSLAGWAELCGGYTVRTGDKFIPDKDGNTLLSTISLALSNPPMPIDTWDAAMASIADRVKAEKTALQQRSL